MRSKYMEERGHPNVRTQQAVSWSAPARLTDDPLMIVASGEKKDEDACARELASKARTKLAEGINPKDARRPSEGSKGPCARFGTDSDAALRQGRSGLLHAFRHPDQGLHGIA